MRKCIAVPILCILRIEWENVDNRESVGFQTIFPFLFFFFYKCKIVNLQLQCIQINKKRTYLNVTMMDARRRGHVIEESN